jgi:hypothetical protein
MMCRSQSPRGPAVGDIAHHLKSSRPSATGRGRADCLCSPSIFLLPPSSGRLQCGDVPVVSPPQRFPAGFQSGGKGRRRHIENLAFVPTAVGFPSHRHIGWRVDSKSGGRTSATFLRIFQPSSDQISIRQGSAEGSLTQSGQRHTKDVLRLGCSLACQLRDCFPVSRPICPHGVDQCTPSAAPQRCSIGREHDFTCSL